LDGSTVIFDEWVSATTFTASGKISSAKNITAATFNVLGAALSGTGSYVATSLLEIAPSKLGALNTLLSSKLVVRSAGKIGFIGTTLVFQSGSEFIVETGAVFTVSAAANFNYDAAPARFTLAGTLAVTAIFSVNVDIYGTGLISVPSGLFHHLARVIHGPALSLNGGALFESDTLTLNGVSGVGLLNVSAALTPTSTFGDVKLRYLDVYGGNVAVNSLSIDDTLAISFGNLILTTTGTVGSFLFSGGSITGESSSTRLNTQGLTFSSDITKTLDRLTISAKNVTYNCPPSTVLTANGAVIVTGF